MTEVDKVYYPESYEDKPIEGSIMAESVTETSDSPKAASYTPAANNTGLDRQFPVKPIAYATISESINTQQKRILGEYQFGELGAIKIGKYENGVSGELKVSPGGILAKNINGDTTFSLDGATGDATFKGTIQANDFVVADENGLVSLSNFEIKEEETGLISQQITSSVYTDVTNANILIELPRETNVLIMYSIRGYWDSIVPGDYAGDLDVEIQVDMTMVGGVVHYRGYRIAGNESLIDPIVLPAINVQKIAAGAHMVRLRAKVTPVGVGNAKYILNSARLITLRLGS